PVPYDAEIGRYEGDPTDLALAGEYRVATPDGEVVCHPAFELYRRLCRRYSPDVVDSITWIPREQLEETARLLWDARPVSYYAYADLFMTPTAEMADVVFPIASAFEREALKIGFEVSQEAQSVVQLRPAFAAPRGEARPDVDVVFGLAERLGFGDQFWNGDI